MQSTQTLGAAPPAPGSDSVISRTSTVRRAGPGEVGSHFDNTTACPSVEALSAECGPAAYRHYPRVPGSVFGVRAFCVHGIFLGGISSDRAVRDLPYYAPFITIREPRHG